jgi:hypothetical protein
MLDRGIGLCAMSGAVIILIISRRQSAEGKKCRADSRPAFPAHFTSKFLMT